MIKTLRWIKVLWLVNLIITVSCASSSDRGTISTLTPSQFPITPSLVQITVSQIPTPAVTSVAVKSPIDFFSRIAWNPNGTLFATTSGGAADHAVHLWNSHGELVANLVGHSDGVFSISWSPDGKLLASGSRDQTVRLWDQTGKLLKVLKINMGTVYTLSWSPDGKILATGSIVNFLNPTVELWSVEDKLLLTVSTKFSGGKFYNLIWSSDGKLLLGGATDYSLWKIDGTQIFYLRGCEHCTPSWGAAWSPDSSRFALGDENGDLAIYDAQGNVLESHQSFESVNTIAWSPDGKLMAAGSELRKSDGTYEVLSNDKVNIAAWSHDGKYLALGSEKQVLLFNGKTGEHMIALEGSSDGANRLAWSPTAHILVSVSLDNTIHLWELP